MKFFYLLALVVLMLTDSLNQIAIASNDCINDQQCEEGEVCATVKGELPGSCALSIEAMPVNPESATGCMNDQQCDEGEVCATVRGEFPGSCARKGNKLF